MQRREFLTLATLGTEFLSRGRSSARSESREFIMSVTGPVPARRLGQTLTHEHVMVDFIGARQIRKGRYDPESVFQKVLPHLRLVKAAGCESLVECTPAFLGRDPQLLRRLSVASGLSIITNTGFYGASNNKYLPEFAYTESAHELAARWIQEFDAGISPSGVRPAIIKIGVDAGPLSSLHAKLVAAAALAHRRTGLSIASHTGDGTAAVAEIEVLRQHKVDPAAFIWVHAQMEPDVSIHRRAAQLGAWVSFDGVAAETLAQHVSLVLGMKRAGFLYRVLISQDAGRYHVGEPDGGEFRGYTALFSNLLPALRKAGLSEGDIYTLLVKNPREVLIARPRTVGLIAEAGA